MRSECRHYESRTYTSGEVVRKCRLDAAPEAPWRCPENCAVFEVRRMDVGWQYGSLAAAANKPEALPATSDDASVAALLNEAEDIVNSAAPAIIADFQPKKKRRLGKKKKK